MILKENYVKYRFFNAALCLLICVAFLSSCAIDMGTKAGVINTQNSRVLLYVYMDATPSSNFIANLKNVSFKSSEGSEFSIPLKLLTIESDDVKKNQRLIASGVVPSGHYDSVEVSIETDSFNGKIKLPYNAFLKSSSTEVINLKWKINEQIDSEPLFEIQALENVMATGNSVLMSFDESDYIVFIDKSSLRVVGALTVCKNPSGLDYDAIKNEIYVACYAVGEVSVIDFNSKKVTRSYKLSGAGSIDVMYLPNVQKDFSGNVYVLNKLSNSVSVLDTKNWTEVNIIETGLSPEKFIFNKDRQEMYVLNSASNNITVLSTVLERIINTIELEASPIDAILMDDKETMYVLSATSSSVFKVSVSQKKVIQRISLFKEPLRVIEGVNYLYIYSKTGEVSFYDKNLNFIDEIDLNVSSNAIAFDSYLNKLFAGSNSKKLNIVDVIKKITVKTVDLEDVPFEVLVLE